MNRFVVATVVALAATPAIAEDRTPIAIPVGATVEHEVGYARGHVCDDTTIVRAEIREKSPETNAIVITGLAAGTTLCRAGLDSDRPTLLFEITVSAPKATPGKPAPKKPGPQTPAGPPPKKR